MHAEINLRVTAGIITGLHLPRLAVDHNLPIPLQVETTDGSHRVDYTDHTILTIQWGFGHHPTTQSPATIEINIRARVTIDNHQPLDQFSVNTETLVIPLTYLEGMPPHMHSVKLIPKLRTAQWTITKDTGGTTGKPFTDVVYPDEPQPITR